MRTARRPDRNVSLTEDSRTGDSQKATADLLKKDDDLFVINEVESQATSVSVEHFRQSMPRSNVYSLVTEVSRRDRRSPPHCKTACRD